MKRIIKPISVIIFTLLLIKNLDFYHLGLTTVQAVGDLTIDWGVPSGNPIFSEENVLPGNEYARTISITNNAPTSRVIGIKGILISGLLNNTDAYDIVISQDSTDLYGGGDENGIKTLKMFFNESNNLLGLPLAELNGGETSGFEIKLTMLSSTESEQSNQEITFDLTIGTTLALPSACTMNFNGEVIEGTAGNDRLVGTSRNDLIIAREGNDRVNGGGGNDCLLGGIGNDRMDAGSGTDVILGEEGTDNLSGGSGPDILQGGEGNDRLDGGSGADVLTGNEGEDNLNGGSGIDDCEGEILVKCE